MQAVVLAADVQDRDGGVLLMSTLFGMFPFLLKLYADSGYLGVSQSEIAWGPKFQQGLSRVCRQINVEIVKRSDAGRFVVLPKRWIMHQRRAGRSPGRLARSCLVIHRPQRSVVTVRMLIASGAAMTSWTRMDERIFAAEIAAFDGTRYRLSLERLPNRNWDWTVWREDRPRLCHYGVAPGPGPGFAAAEQAVRYLMAEAQG